MVANCDRTCPLSRRMLIAASALAVGFSLSAAAQTASAPAAAQTASAPALAQGQIPSQSYSSSSSPYEASLSTSALPGASYLAAPTASPSPQYGNNRYPSYQSSFSHIAFDFGGGLTAPIGNDTHPYEAPGYNVNETWGWNLNVGAGWNFTKHLGALLEYQFDKQKIPGATLSAIWAEANTEGAGLTYPLGGNINTWSLTVDPVYYLPMTKKTGAFVTGGGGFYRKVTNFTEPELSEFCYGFYGCGYGYQPATAAHSSSNQGGINAGLGLYWKAFGEDSNAKFYAEARYVWVDSPASSDKDPFGGGTEGLIPITIGLRF